MLQNLFRSQLQPWAGQNCTTMWCLQHLSPRTHNGQSSWNGKSSWTTGQPNNRAGFQAHHCGSSSLGQSCGGHRNMRNSRMNRYTITNTSEFQRCLHSIYFDAHSTNNCHRCRSESLQKIAKFLGRQLGWICVHSSMWFFLEMWCPEPVCCGFRALLTRGLRKISDDDDYY